MEVGDNVITFNVYEAMRHPFEDYSLLGLSTLDAYIEETQDEHELLLQHSEKAEYELFKFEISSSSVFSLDSSGDVSSINQVSVDSLLSTLQSFSFTVTIFLLRISLQNQNWML